MSRPRPAPTLALALVLLAPLVSGCTLFGESEADAGGAVEGWDQPHVALAVQNDAPGIATVTYRLLDGAGATSAEGTLEAPVGETTRAPVPLQAEGQLRIVLDYSWSGEGRASSGSNEGTFHTASCPGAPTVHLRIHVADDGRTFSDVSVGCDAAA